MCNSFPLHCLVQERTQIEAGDCCSAVHTMAEREREREVEKIARGRTHSTPEIYECSSGVEAKRERVRMEDRGGGEWQAEIEGGGESKLILSPL